MKRPRHSEALSGRVENFFEDKNNDSRRVRVVYYKADGEANWRRGSSELHPETVTKSPPRMCSSETRGSWTRRIIRRRIYKKKRKQAGRSEASGDEISRDDVVGIPNNPEESSRKRQEQSSTVIDQANIDGVSQPRRSFGAQAQAESYLANRKIFELFNLLIGHLLVHEPDDPVGYLYDLLDKCTLFRTGLAEPPLLFDPRHIRSLFESLDPGGLGEISLDEYRTGMETLGIASYDKNPRESVPGRVDKSTFENEAKRCLVRMLSEMIGKSD